MPRLEMLETRLAPATTITVLEGGAGTLDGFLSATDGTITAADNAGVAGSISRAALQGVNANVNISITAEMSITVDNLTAGALALQTDMAHFASFIASTGTLNFNDQLDSITTAGGDLSLVAVTSMSLGGLNSGGGDIVIQADDVDIQAAINAGAGIVTIQQSTAGRDIDLGTETGGQTSLTNAELNQVTAGVLRIGAINGGDIRVTAAITLTNVPTLSLLSVMTISDTANASLTVTNNASFTATSIDLGNQAGDTFNFGSLTFNSGGDVSISEVISTLLTGTSTANSLTLSAGALTNAANASLTVINNASFTATSIDLGNQAGDTFNFGSLTFNSTGVVSISEDSSTLLTGTSTAGSLTLVSAGALTNAANASLTVTVNASFTATSIDLGSQAGDTFNFSSLTFNSGGAVSISEDSYTSTLLTGTNTANSLTLVSTGALTNAANASLTVINNASFTVVFAFAFATAFASFTAFGIDLGNQAGDTFNFGSLTFRSADCSISEDSSTQLTGGSSANPLTLVSAGALTNAANARLTGISVTQTNNASFTATSIDLGNQAGDIFNFSSLTFIGGGAVSITEDSLLANNLSASGSNSAPGAQVNLTVQGGGTLTVNAGNISSNNGDITLSADDMTITGTVNAGTAIVTLQQAGAAGRPIDLGTNTGGTLGLTDAELDRVTASILRIGRTDNAGAIGISAPLDTANTSTLSLRTGGAINETGTGTITVTNLNLRGAAGVNLDTNPNSVTGRLAGSTSNQRFVFVNSGTLTVGTADTQNGINLGSGTGGLRANGSAILNGLSAGNDVTAGKMGLNGMGGLGTSLSPLTLAIGMLNTISGNAPEFLSAAATTTIYSTGLNAGTGGIVLTGGTFALSANNLIQSISPVRLAGNATLNVGTFSNTIFALKLIASSTLGIQVNSFSVGHFGQLSVTGPQLLLNGATLNLTLGAGFTKPATGTTIVLIRNIGNAAIVGQFAGHAEGSTITVGGFSFRISYQGGAGHDIALTAL